METIKTEVYLNNGDLLTANNVNNLTANAVGYVGNIIDFTRDELDIIEDSKDIALAIIDKFENEGLKYELAVMYASDNHVYAIASPKDPYEKNLTIYEVFNKDGKALSVIKNVEL